MCRTGASNGQYAASQVFHQEKHIQRFAKKVEQSYINTTKER